MDPLARRMMTGQATGVARPAASRASDTALAASKADTLMDLTTLMSARISAAFHEYIEAAGYQPPIHEAEEHFDPHVAFEGHDEPEPQLSQQRELSLKGKATLQPDVAARGRTHRPPGAEAAKPQLMASPQEVAKLTESIVPLAMEGLLNRAHRDEAARKRDAAKFILLILKAHGNYVYDHCTRLVDLALALSKELGIEDEQVHREVEDGIVYRDLGEVTFFLTKQSPRQRDALAAYLAGVEIAQDSLLHDVGKIQVPQEILYKPGPLTPEETQIMRQHPVWGAEILSKIPPLQHAVPVTRHHHERWDGGGYPSGLKGDEAPLAARLVTVVDTFDALISDRPYRPALPFDVVMDEMRRGVGTQFDPDISRAFLGIVDRVWSPERQY